jgi:hypothetical protein
VLLFALLAFRNVWPAKLLLMAAVVVGASIAKVGVSSSKFVSPSREVAYLDSSLNSLKTTFYRNWIADGQSRAGRIATCLDGYIVSDSDGVLYHVCENAKSSIDVRKLGYRNPANTSEFENGAQKVRGGR